MSNNRDIRNTETDKRLRRTVRLHVECRVWGRRCEPHLGAKRKMRRAAALVAFVCDGCIVAEVIRVRTNVLPVFGCTNPSLEANIAGSKESHSFFLRYAFTYALRARA